MKFKTDENMSQEAVDVLLGAGHDVATVLSQALGGADDPDILSVCRAEGRVLITADRPLADSRALSGIDHPGVVVLRLPKRGRLLVADVIKGLLPALSDEAVKGRIWVVEPDRIRIRS